MTTLYVLVAVVIATTIIERVSGNPFLATGLGLIYARIHKSTEVVSEGFTNNRGGYVDTRNPFGRRLFLTDRDIKGINFDPAAITIGRVVIVERQYALQNLLRHEDGHVRQYNRMTSLGFLFTYLYWAALKTIKHGKGWWDNHPLEIEAEAYADSFQTGL